MWCQRRCAVGSRGSFHLGVLAFVVLTLVLTGLDPVSVSSPVTVPKPTFTATDLAHVVVSTPIKTPSPPRQDPRPIVPAVTPTREPKEPEVSSLVQQLVRAPAPRADSPAQQRAGVITYTVESGDNVLGIANRFGLQRETVIWSNPSLEVDPNMLYVGQVIDILPVDGVYHTVTAGETLDEIAQLYGVPQAAVVDCAYNEFLGDDYGVIPGQKLVVPGGVKSFNPRYVRFDIRQLPENAPRGTGDFVWPVGGYVSQGYWNLHRAIDIAGDLGAPVVAADAGVVVYASWECSGYGNLVIVDHGNGFVSYYAHLYGFFVDVGQPVQRGQPLGERGNTGRSTGPHLHFEIRQENAHRNPLDLLPKE